MKNFFIFSLVLLCFLFWWNRYTLKFYNPYRSTMIFGKKGSGKSTYLAKIACKYNKMGWKVFSTENIVGTYKLDCSKLGEYNFPPNSILLIDEVSLIWSNRDFKSFDKKTERFFRKHRHQKVKIIMFSQTFDIDLKIRNLVDDMYLFRNVFTVFTYGRRIEKYMTINNTSSDSTSKLDESFDFSFLLSKGSVIITFIPRWIEFFDSFELDPLPVAPQEYIKISEYQKNLYSNKFWFANSFKGIVIGLAAIPLYRIMHPVFFMKYYLKKFKRYA